MKIKHYLALPMALLLMGSLFTGCGSKDDSSMNDSVSSSAADDSSRDDKDDSKDDSKDDGGNIVSDAEDGVRDIVTDAGDAVRDAGDAAGDAVKDAGDAAGDMLGGDDDSPTALLPHRSHTDRRRILCPDTLHPHHAGGTSCRSVCLRGSHIPPCP